MGTQERPSAEIDLPDFLSELQTKSARSAARRILRSAKERGRITTSEIAELLPRSILRDRALLSRVIQHLGTYLLDSRVALANPTQKQEFSGSKKNARRARNEDIAPPAASPGGVDYDERSQRRRVACPRRDEDHDRVHDIVEPQTTDDLFCSEGELGHLTSSELELFEAESEYLEDPLLRYYQACRKYPLLSKEQEQELSRRVCEDGDLSARNELVCHNLRLVRSVARRYAWSKLPFADLIQEGNLGLITAAEKFDWRVGTRFTTYAYWWIRQAVTRAILQYSDVIRLPVHIGMLRLNILQAIDRMCIDGGRIPTPEAIAEYLDTPLPAVKNALRAMHLQNPIPLDGIPRSGEEGDEINLQDLVADPNGADPSVILEAKQELLAIYNDLRIILDAIKELPGNRERNITVFKEMHGLGPSGEKRTLEEVGQEFGVTRERIRQILLRIFESLAEQGIEVDQQALRDHLWRVQELEKLSGTLFAELD